MELVKAAASQWQPLCPHRRGAGSATRAGADAAGGPGGAWHRPRAGRRPEGEQVMAVSHASYSYRVPVKHFRCSHCCSSNQV